MATFMLCLVAIFTSVIAQVAEVPPCCSVDQNTIPDNIKGLWCQYQEITCNTICGQQGFLGNTCDTGTLEYKCQCPDGHIPNLDSYEDTIPSLMCDWWVSVCINASSVSRSSCSSAACGTKIQERTTAILYDRQLSSTLNSTSVRTVSTTHYPGSTTATFQLAPTSIIHPTYPYSTYPYVSQTETGVPSSNSSRIRINRDAKIVIVIIVVFLFLGCSGLLLWCCVFKKGLDRGMLVFLGLRKAPSVSEQRVPLNPSGIGVVESDDPSSFQKPELHSEPAQSGLEANQNVGWSKNHQSSHGILFELDANISRTNITSVRAPSHSYADDVERNLDRHATSSYGPITRNSPRSKIDYQDQDILANATFAAAPNSGPPIPSSTAIEMEFVRAPVNLSNAAHSFSPSEDIGWRYSIGKVKRLEEEEKKIDAEIEKFKRVKDLKEQKFEIQKRLMEAKTGIRDV